MLDQAVTRTCNLHLATIDPLHICKVLHGNHILVCFGIGSSVA